MQHVKIMRVIKTAFFVICLVLLNVSVVMAQGGGAPVPGGPPATPNDELPINDHMAPLLVLTIVFGITVLYKNKIKKASI